MTNSAPTALDTIPGYTNFLDRLGAHLKASMPAAEYAALEEAASAAASTIEARSGKTRSGLIEDESVTPSGGTQETLINQDFANE